ncbi:MAG: putative peptidoglycan glycosyltransferase FtsW [Candidatus Dichloromethanomonas elyunquensis]|nr:MAG: putative peptidoglycan glycosyltransferase FtsW [Candidatus Dichloromethanomonas elyunquensis]
MPASKIKPRKPDFILLFASIVLLAVGLIMVLSASSLFAFNQTDNSFFLFYKQLKWACLGLVASFAAVLIPYKFWKKFSGIGVLVTIFLLLLVEFSNLSVTAKGSSRWLNIAGISVQPSEIAKLTLVLFLAYILNRYPVKKIKDLFLSIPVIGVVLLLVYKQPDLGTAVVILLACGAMFLMTELPAGYFLAAVPILGIAGYRLVRGSDYQWKRILGWLYPWQYYNDLGFQSVRAQIAFGTGGLLGIGIGQSTRSGYLPENYTDTIFAVIGEEFGFFGTSFVLIFFILLITRAFIISRQCPDRFGRLLGFGIASLLALQTAVNLCVVTGLSPVTGITLPLISYGGTSLLITMFEIGILLNISRYRRVDENV